MEKTLIPDSYACRTDKGMHRALFRTVDLTKTNHYFLKLDIRKYFETISHSKLKEMVCRKIKDENALWLIDTIIEHVPKNYSNGYGLPIGNLTSQHFANFFLSPLDHYIQEKLKVKAYLRYMDDMLLMSSQKNLLWSAFQDIVIFIQDRLELKLKEKATCLAPIVQGIPFLGYKIYPNKVWIQKKNWRRFKRKFMARQEDFRQAKISSEKLARSVSGMLNYLSYANTGALLKKFLARFDVEI